MVERLAVITVCPPAPADPVGRARFRAQLRDAIARGPCVLVIDCSRTQNVPRPAVERLRDAKEAVLNNGGSFVLKACLGRTPALMRLADELAQR